MPRKSIIGLAAMVFATTLSAQRSAVGNGDALDEYIRAEMAKRQIPGLAVGVIHRGEARLAVYGKSSLEYETPVTADTLFNVASVSKAFTAVAIMRMVEDGGAVALDDPIGRHLKELLADWQRVTVRRLLNHTSGLPVIDADPYSMRTLAQTVPTALALLGARPMESATGTKWTYNQTNYMLLGMLVETLSGQSFAAFSSDRIFRPLGLTPTFGDSRTVMANRATVYTRFRYDTDPPRRIEAVEVLAYETPTFNYPAGGLNISIRDFMAWLAALQQGRLVSRPSLDELWKPATLSDGAVYKGLGTSWTSYGLGWTLNLSQPRPKVGGTGGLRAAFAVYPDNDFSVAVLTNLQGAGPDSLVDGIAGVYLNPK